eukprot:6198420-Pleurochrysis_carterae.AAC.3
MVSALRPKFEARRTQQALQLGALLLLLLGLLSMLLAKWMGLVSFFAGAAGISGLFLKLTYEAASQRSHASCVPHAGAVYYASLVDGCGGRDGDSELDSTPERRRRLAYLASDWVCTPAIAILASADIRACGCAILDALRAAGVAT